MTNQNSKYKISILTISIGYLYFFLLFPFFHYHKLSENNSIEVEKFHSHLSNDLQEHQHDSSEDHHSIDSFSNHHHFVKLNTIESISLKRIINFTFPQLVTENYLGNNAVKYSKCLIDTQPENNILWEKCVQTATNVSPPLV